MHFYLNLFYRYDIMNTTNSKGVVFMQYIISGKNIDVTEGLRSAVSDKIGKLERYFTPETEVHVTLSVEKERQKIEVTIPMKGNIIRAEQVSDDMYVSIDLVEEIIERQLRKYKNKIIDQQQSAIGLSKAFVEEEIDKNELYKTMDKIRTIQSFAEEKPAQIVARLKSICQAYEVKADQPTLAYLVEMCGTNMQELINEIRKLIEYAGKGGTIDKKAVDLLCTRKPDSVIFNLTDYLGKKEIANAFRVLQDLKYQKEPTQLILIMLYNHFKKLYYTKKAVEEGRQDLVTLLNLKPNQDFLVSKYRTQAGRFQTEDLRGLLESLADLDYQSKQGTIDIDIGLEAILCQYCA